METNVVGKKFGLGTVAGIVAIVIAIAAIGSFTYASSIHAVTVTDSRAPVTSISIVKLNQTVPYLITQTSVSTYVTTILGTTTATVTAAGSTATVTSTATSLSTLYSTSTSMTTATVTKTNYSTVTSTTTAISTTNANEPPTVTVSGTAKTTGYQTTATEIDFIGSTTTYHATLPSSGSGSYSITLPNGQDYKVVIDYSIYPTGASSCNAGKMPLYSLQATLSEDWSC